MRYVFGIAIGILILSIVFSSNTLSLLVFLSQQFTALLRELIKSIFFNFFHLTLVEIRDHQAAKPVSSVTIRTESIGGHWPDICRIKSNDETSTTSKCSPRANVESENLEAEKVLDLLKEGEEEMKFQFGDAVIVLGNTGAGKSTFTRFITGNNANLISYESIAGSEDYIIKDVSGKISDNSTITSWTVFPELVKDLETRTPFYDCPGYSDTRGIAHDIAATYFTKDLLKHLDRIKMIFTINYSSVRVGLDRHDFMLFAEHVVTMVKNIKKFSDSIALVITKVDNQYNKKGNLLPDENVIESAAGFLNLVRDELLKKMETSDDFNHPKISGIVNFIDIILEKRAGKYPKIGIFRRPDEPGPLSKSHSLKESKASLEKIIHGAISFTKHHENDFDYTISAASKNNIHDLVERIKDNIVLSVSCLQKDTEDHFVTLEKELGDVQVLQDIFHSASNILSSSSDKFTKPSDFVEQMRQVMQSLSINSSQEHLSNILKYDGYLEFFQTFGARVVQPAEWAQDYTVTLSKELRESAIYYKFLSQLVGVLSSYDVQRSKSNYKKLIDDFFNGLGLAEILTMQEIEMLISRLQLQGEEYLDYAQIKYLELSPAKLNRLRSVFDFVFNSIDDTQCYAYSQRVVIKSNFVLVANLSAMIDGFCPGAKTIEIFALEKIFFDADLDLNGKEAQVSIVSPTWEIIDKHNVILDGIDGPVRIRKEVPSGGLVLKTNREGEGDPGYAGSPAGSFLGVGQKFINSEDLHISSVGGRGGPGQKGEDGKHGSHGSEARGGEFCRPDTGVFGFLGLTQICDGAGADCTDGSGGRDGGAGGRGGKSGQVEIISPSSQARVSVKVADGATGAPGTRSWRCWRKTWLKRN